MTSYSAILAASFATTLAGAAIAADLDEGPSRGFTVKYSSDELTTAAGARRVALRIEAAANEVCGGDTVLSSTGPGFSDCRMKAVTLAADQIGSPLVRQALGLERAAAVASR
jgi:UrcA family protein